MHSRGQVDAGRCALNAEGHYVHGNVQTAHTRGAGSQRDGKCKGRCKGSTCGRPLVVSSGEVCVRMAVADAACWEAHGGA